MTVVALLLAAHKTILWPHAISALFYTTDYYNAILGDPNTGFSHTWSLGIEEQFYLLWPFVFAKFCHDLKKMTVLLATIVGVVWVHRCVLYFLFHFDQAYFYAAFDTRLDSLMVGCLLAVLLKRGVFMSLWQAACRNIVMPLLTCTLLLASIFAGPMLVPRYRDLIGFAVDPLLVAVIIVQMLALSSTAYLNWLEWSWVRFLGDISYSLYLWQQTTLSLSAHLHLPLPIKLAVAVAFTIAVASLSYYVVERPFLKLKDKSFRLGVRRLLIAKTAT